MTDSPAPTIAQIKAVVAEHYGLPVGEMTSRRQSRAVARPRQVAMWLARMMTLHSLPEIGREFGNRDHTTVLHAVRMVNDRLVCDAQFYAHVGALRARLARTP